jgi:Spy/CpxP family protein refolding chaperone
MNRFACWVLGLALGLPFGFARADDKPQPSQPPGRPGSAASRGPQERPLLPEGAIEKLQLTAEQKEKVEKLFKELADHQKEMQAKLEELSDKARRGDTEARRQLAEHRREMYQNSQKQRETVEAKLKEILNAEQKKKFAELVRTVPEYPGSSPGRPAGPVPGGFGRSAFGGPFQLTPGQVLPPMLQDMLKLTPEQKEKVEKLQKETEAKLMELLTQDQKKQLEEFKKRMSALPRLPGAPPQP